MKVEEGQVVPGCVPPFRGACRWLLSLDYDETLRSASAAQPVSAEFFELMSRWRHLGVRWGINTGRSLPYLCQDFLPCAPFLPDFICTCERYVYLAGQDGRLHPLRAYNDCCFDHNMELRKRVRPLLHERLASLRAGYPELRWEIAADDPLSVEAVNSATMDSIMALLNSFISTLPGVTAQRAGRYMRLADSRYCKGTALETVAAHWGVPQERWAMLGDGHNDLQAFRLFPDAFCGAPANAHPDVLAYLRSCGGYISPVAGVMEILQAWHDSRMTKLW